MKLRVLTPTRGGSPHWLTAAASITAFAPEAEHVVICPDTSAVSAPRHPGGRTIWRDEGRGLYAALNRGLRAPGDWDAFTWLNDDDVLAAGFRAAWQQLAAAPHCGAVYGRVGLIDTRGAGIGALPIAAEPADLVALLRRGIMPLAQPGTIIRRRLVEQIGAMDESYRLAGDLDFFARALDAGIRFGHCPDKVADFRLRAGQLSQQEELGAQEFARAVGRLRAKTATGGTAALLRFRWANRGVYWDRWRKHGGVTMRELYRRA
jgi:hypothetical protein